MELPNDNGDSEIPRERNEHGNPIGKRVCEAPRGRRALVNYERGAPFCRGLRGASAFSEMRSVNAFRGSRTVRLVWGNWAVNEIRGITNDTRVFWELRTVSVCLRNTIGKCVSGSYER